MLLSEHFTGKVDGGEWFDILLDSDTKLFVDPFLIYKETQGHWANAHDDLLAHFDEVFMLLAKSGLKKNSPYFIKAVSHLVFHEPEEFCLGYTARGTRGSGGGYKLAAQIAKAMREAIKRGIKHLDHFELLGVFNAGIGPDRISDLTCTILKRYFIEYTAKIAKERQLDTTTYEMWVGPNSKELLQADLPENPISKEPILLVPKRFLRRLPTLYAEDWWEWHVHRAGLNIDLLEGVRKKEIVAEAVKHVNAVNQWVDEREKGTAAPYDVDADPDLVWRWDPITAKWVSSNMLNLAPYRRVDRFPKLIELLLAQYKQFIEHEGGWKHLWNDDMSEKHEDASQSLFRGIAKHYCHANGISIDREVNLGQGPVDFKFSKGREFVAHLEVKKLHNGSFWNGLEKQLITYMVSDKCENGWLLAIQLRPKGISEQRLKDLPEAVSNLSKASGLNIRYGAVNGMRRQSASKQK